MGSYDFEHCGHKQHFACFGCRKAFKAGYEFVRHGHRDYRPRVVTCPECREPMRAMGLLFRAPPQQAVKAWRRLAESGAKFSLPRTRWPEGACPSCGPRSRLVTGKCPYCGFSRKTAAGGRPTPKDYRPVRKRRR